MKERERDAFKLKCFSINDENNKKDSKQHKKMCVRVGGSKVKDEGNVERGRREEREIENVKRWREDEKRWKRNDGGKMYIF
jgi:hypothetical protein